MYNLLSDLQYIFMAIWQNIQYVRAVSQKQIIEELPLLKTVENHILFLSRHYLKNDKNCIPVILEILLSEKEKRNNGFGILDLYRAFDITWPFLISRIYFPLFYKKKKLLWILKLVWIQYRNKIFNQNFLSGLISKNSMEPAETQLFLFRPIIR